MNLFSQRITRAFSVLARAMKTAPTPGYDKQPGAGDGHTIQRRLERFGTHRQESQLVTFFDCELLTFDQVGTPVIVGGQVAEFVIDQ